MFMNIKTKLISAGVALLAVMAPVNSVVAPPALSSEDPVGYIEKNGTRIFFR